MPAARFGLVRASFVHPHGKPIPFEQSGEFPQVPAKARKPPEPTRAPRRVATHPDAHAACFAPRVLVPA